MRRILFFTPILLLEAFLLFRLFHIEDLVLGFLIFSTQAVVFILSLNFESNFTSDSPNKNPSLKYWFAFFLGIFLILIPLFMNRQISVEPSSWKEVAILLKGPYESVFWFLGLFACLLSIFGSIYVRKRNELD